MKKAAFAAISAFAISVPAGTAFAGFPVPVEMTCAVGGEEFTHTTTSSYSTWGSRPDGKPYGSWTFPMPLPVCPENGLVMYRDFTPEEVALLETYVSSNTYAELLGDTPYYRASHIEEHLIVDSGLTPIWLLMRAAWETDHDLERKARYQREFAERVEALPRDRTGQDWLFLIGRAANARRELGEFAEAAALLESIGTIDTDSVEWDDDKSPRERERWIAGWHDYTTGLSSLIAQGNAESEPLSMIPANMAAMQCMDAEDAGEEMPPLCRGERLRDAIEGLRARQAIFEDERDDASAGGEAEAAVAVEMSEEAQPR